MQRHVDISADTQAWRLLEREMRDLSAGKFDVAKYI